MELLTSTETNSFSSFFLGLQNEPMERYGPTWFSAEPDYTAWRERHSLGFRGTNRVYGYNSHSPFVRRERVVFTLDWYSAIGGTPRLYVIKPRIGYGSLTLRTRYSSNGENERTSPVPGWFTTIEDVSEFRGPWWDDLRGAIPQLLSAVEDLRRVRNARRAREQEKRRADAEARERHADTLRREYRSIK